jgi:hypothetical protein
MPITPVSTPDGTAIRDYITSRGDAEIYAIFARAQSSTQQLVQKVSR